MLSVSVRQLTVWGMILLASADRPGKMFGLTPEMLLQSRRLRSVDFRNFSFPAPNEHVDEDLRPLRQMTNIGPASMHLRNGFFRPGPQDSDSPLDFAYAQLRNVTYGDVTDDGHDEAIVDLQIGSGGTMKWGLVYIYEEQGNELHLKALLLTGDRAHGGLRRAYAKHGKLVLETYVPEYSRGDCCPTRFARHTLTWHNGRFAQTGQAPILTDENR